MKPCWKDHRKLSGVVGRVSELCWGDQPCEAPLVWLVLRTMILTNMWAGHIEGHSGNASEPVWGCMGLCMWWLSLAASSAPLSKNELCFHRCRATPVQGWIFCIMSWTEGTNVLSNTALQLSLLPVCRGHFLTLCSVLFQQDNVDLGELMFSLCYLPTAGRLTITIIKARNLKAMDITGASGGTCFIWF